MTGDKGEPLKRVEPGDRLDGNLTAGGWNAAMDAAQYVRDRRLSQSGEPGPAFRQTGIIKVKNVSGADVDRFGVLALGDAVFDPGDEDALPEFQRQVAVEGDVADAGATLIGVLLEPIPENGIGRAVVAGACVARVRITDPGHTFAKPDGTHTEFMVSSSDTAPCRIIYRPPGEEPYEAWCYVLLGGGAAGGFAVGKLDGVLNQGSSATMSIWAWNGAAYADTGENVTVYDWLLSSGQSVAGGKKVSAQYDARSGRWFVTGAECS